MDTTPVKPGPKHRLQLHIARPGQPDQGGGQLQQEQAALGQVHPVLPQPFHQTAYQLLHLLRRPKLDRGGQLPLVILVQGQLCEVPGSMSADTEHPAPPMSTR